MQTIDFYFDFISPYAYLAYKALPEIAASHEAEIVPHPVLFAAMLNHHGQLGPAEIPAKREYVFKDVYRSASARGWPIEPPPTHPFNPLTALRICSLEMPSETRWKLIGRLFDMTWAGGGGVSDANALAKVAAELGVDNAPERIADPDLKARLRDTTEAAITCGAFGVPTMLVGEELFWGYDSLDHLDRFLGGADPLPDDLWERWEHIKPSASRR